MLILVLTLALAQMPAIARVVDGSKTPHEIPEHVMWDMGFSHMNNLKANRIEAGLALLPLSPADAGLAFAEAQRQIERRNQCSAKGDKVFERYTGQGQKDAGEKIEKELQAISL